MHGRKCAGPGENFSGSHRFLSGMNRRAVSTGVGRRATRHLSRTGAGVEAAHDAWVWPDRSAAPWRPNRRRPKTPSSSVVSWSLSRWAKFRCRPETCRAPGLMRPTGSRNALQIGECNTACHATERQRLAADPSRLLRWPARSSRDSRISGVPWRSFARRFRSSSATGAHGHTQIVDPAEETFPYSGRVEFIEPEGAGSITAGRAETGKAETRRWVARHRAEIQSRDRQARAGASPSTVPTPPATETPARAARPVGRASSRRRRWSPFERERTREDADTDAAPP